MSEVSTKSVCLFLSSSSSPVFHPSTPPLPIPHALVSPSSPVCVNHSLYHQMLLKERWELWSALQWFTYRVIRVVCMTLCYCWLCFWIGEIVCRSWFGVCAQIQFWTSPPTSVQSPVINWQLKVLKAGEVVGRLKDRAICVRKINWT